jgi:hypothetical protein
MAEVGDSLLTCETVVRALDWLEERDKDTALLACGAIVSAGLMTAAKNYPYSHRGPQPNQARSTTKKLGFSKKRAT